MIGSKELPVAQCNVFVYAFMSGVELNELNFNYSELNASKNYAVYLHSITFWDGKDDISFSSGPIKNSVIPLLSLKWAESKAFVSRCNEIENDDL